MTTVAPVCPVSRDQAVAAQPGIKQPPLTRAFDLPSLIAAVNNIALRLQPLTGPVPINNLPYFSPVLTPVKVKINVLHEGKWAEVDRDTERITIYHKDTATGQSDRTQKLYVVRINQVTFMDIYGQAWDGPLIWAHP